MAFKPHQRHTLTSQLATYSLLYKTPPLFLSTTLEKKANLFNAAWQKEQANNRRNMANLIQRHTRVTLYHWRLENRRRRKEGHSSSVGHWPILSLMSRGNGRTGVSHFIFTHIAPRSASRALLSFHFISWPFATDWQWRQYQFPVSEPKSMGT